MSVLTASPELAYATKGNIVVPAGEPKSAATIASQAASRLQDIHAAFSAVTLSQPKKSNS